MREFSRAACTSKRGRGADNFFCGHGRGKVDEQRDETDGHQNVAKQHPTFRRKCYLERTVCLTFLLSVEGSLAQQGHGRCWSP